MHFEQERSAAEVLAELRAEAERTWGPERAAALAGALENSANALWRLAQAPLDLLEVEPDFVSGGTRREAGV